MNQPDSPQYVSVNCPKCNAPLSDQAEQIVCPYCGSLLLRTHQASSQASASPQNPTVVSGLHLKPYTCFDQQGTGMQAFSLLIPTGWNFTGGVVWRLDNPGTPAAIAFQLVSPDGTEILEVFPSLTFFYTNISSMLMTKPVGSVYFGNEVRPPCGAGRGVQEIFLPRFRSRAGNLQILNMEVNQNLAQQMQAMTPQQPTQGMSAEGAKTRIQFQWENHQWEEEIYAVFAAVNIHTPGLFGSQQMVFWSLDYLHSFRTLSGKLDSWMNLFQTIVHSYRLNPHWFAAVMQASQFMIQNQIQHIQHIGQISRIISQTSREISDVQMQAYYQRQQTMEHLSASFSQYMRGVDAFYDPHKGTNVELPSGYQHAWANSLGVYVVPDTPNYNPNVGSNLNWTSLTPP